MATIETLDGPLETAELGTVLMHEHVFNLTAEVQIAHPGFNGWDPAVEDLENISDEERAGLEVAA